MLHPLAPYWMRGVEATPAMTGASSLMACQDIHAHAQALGFTLPLSQVIDVGCGSGRVAQVCHGYQGYDISPDAVAYCTARGIPASCIVTPADIAPPIAPAWILCLSVWTHIDHDDRRAYMARFAELATPTTRLLVDVIPGDGSGDVALWTCDWYVLEHDLQRHGWIVRAFYDRTAPTGPRHRYALCVRQEQP